MEIETKKGKIIKILQINLSVTIVMPVSLNHDHDMLTPNHTNAINRPKILPIPSYNYTQKKSQKNYMILPQYQLLKFY